VQRAGGKNRSSLRREPSIWRTRSRRRRVAVGQAAPRNHSRQVIREIGRGRKVCAAAGVGRARGSEVVAPESGRPKLHISHVPPSPSDRASVEKEDGQRTARRSERESDATRRRLVVSRAFFESVALKPLSRRRCTRRRKGGRCSGRARSSLVECSRQVEPHRPASVLFSRHLRLHSHHDD